MRITKEIDKMETLPNSVYVVLDRDMEESIFDTMVFTTYEKAMEYIKDTLRECNELYDKVSQDDKNSWRMQDEGCQPRIIELTNNAVW